MTETGVEPRWGRELSSGVPALRTRLAPRADGVVYGRCQAEGISSKRSNSAAGVVDFAHDFSSMTQRSLIGGESARFRGK
jgi:hypothetical protein